MLLSGILRNKLTTYKTKCTYDFFFNLIKPNKRLILLVIALI